jgi:putative flavoprotein involved in K+ transport
MGHYETGIDTYADPDSVRAKTNHYLTGRDGGREIDLRQFAVEGVRLYGSLRNIEGTTLKFADNLRACLDSADDVYCGIRKLIDEYIEKNGIEAPVEPPFAPKWEPEEEKLSADFRDEHITSIVWASGFGWNFRYVEADVFDAKGYPVYRRGVTEQPGLYFIGLPWLHTWGSGRFSGMARDSAYLLDHIVAQREKAADAEALSGSRRSAVGLRTTALLGDTSNHSTVDAQR